MNFKNQHFLLKNFAYPLPSFFHATNVVRLFYTVQYKNTHKSHNNSRITAKNFYVSEPIRISPQSGERFCITSGSKVHFQSKITIHHVTRWYTPDVSLTSGSIAEFILVEIQLFTMMRDLRLQMLVFKCFENESIH